MQSHPPSYSRDDQYLRVHEHYRDITRVRLASINFNGVYNPDDQTYTFSRRDAPKASTIVSMNPDRRMFTAFTTGDMLTLSDNFDCVEGRTVPIENCTFGAAKMCIEAWSAWKADTTVPFDQMVKPAVEAYTWAKRRTVPRFNDSTLAATDSLRLRDYIPGGESSEIDEKGKDYVRSLCGAAGQMDNSMSINRGLIRYLGIYTQILADLHSTQPVIAKMAYGRSVMYGQIKPYWDNQLDEWSVFFARRLFLACNPDLAYPFLLLYYHGMACEISKDDNLWAYKTDKFDNTVTEDEVQAAAPHKKLGRVNMRIAYSLLGISAADRQLQEIYSISPPAMPEADAQRMLTECLWGNWMNKMMDRQFEKNVDVFNPPKLPHDLILAIVASTQEDVTMLLNAISRQPAPRTDSQRTSSQRTSSVDTHPRY